MWPDLAKFRQFSKSLEIFGNIWKVYLNFGKVENPLWDFLYAFGQNFIIVNGQILKKQSARLVKLFSILLRIGMQSVWTSLKVNNNASKAWILLHITQSMDRAQSHLTKENWAGDKHVRRPGT